MAAKIGSPRGVKRTSLASSAVSQKSQKLPQPDSPETVTPPADWQTVYGLIKVQRKRVSAPVDTMGCAEAGRSEGISPRDRRFGTLVALMLSSQTKDEVTFQAMTNLRANLKNGLSCESVEEASLEEIQASINKVGFWRRKAEYIKAAAASIREAGGDVPQTIEGMLKLRGVGPKMGYLALNSAWGLNHGIGVDTHVHRITNRLGWHRPNTKTEEQTRANLESWLPKHLHQEINPLLVGFGQVICRPVKPLCETCDVGLAGDLCPSSSIKRKVKSNKEEESASAQANPSVKVEPEQ